MGFYCLVLMYNWFFFNFLFTRPPQRELLLSKFGARAGQAWIAIDYVLVEEAFTLTLVWIYQSSLKTFFLKKKICSTLFIYVFNKCIIWSRKIYWKDLFSFLIRSNSWRFISRKCLVKTRRKQTASVARIINQQDFSRLRNLLCDPTNVKDSILYAVAQWTKIICK